MFNKFNQRYKLNFKKYSTLLKWRTFRAIVVTKQIFKASGKIRALYQQEIMKNKSILGHHETVLELSMQFRGW